MQSRTSARFLFSFLLATTVAAGFALPGCGSGSGSGSGSGTSGGSGSNASAGGEEGPLVINQGNGERVSSSRGSEGGVVILWPRVIPSEGAELRQSLAAALQARMRSIVEQALPGVEVDVRPEPQRVCPRAGCLGVSFGAVLIHQGDSCAAAATVARPGTSPSVLFAWSDHLQLRQTNIPFREPPESQIRVEDFTPCDQLIDSLEGRSAEIEAELRRVGHQ